MLNQLETLVILYNKVGIYFCQKKFHGQLLHIIDLKKLGIRYGQS